MLLRQSPGSFSRLIDRQQNANLPEIESPARVSFSVSVAGLQAAIGLLKPKESKTLTAPNKIVCTNYKNAATDNSQKSQPTAN